MHILLNKHHSVVSEQGLHCLRNIPKGVLCLTRMVVQGQLVEPPFVLETYRHVKNCFTQLLDRNQTSCLDRKLFLIFMNQKLMIFTIANDHFIVSPSSVTLIFNLLEQLFQMNNCAKLSEIHA